MVLANCTPSLQVIARNMQTKFQVIQTYGDKGQASQHAANKVIPICCPVRRYNKLGMMPVSTSTESINQKSS